MSEGIYERNALEIWITIKGQFTIYLSIKTP